MSTTRCQFCHEWIEVSEYKLHCEQHTRLKPDGQHTDYITLPPEEREQGDLADAPKIYFHPRCGGYTVMPDEIIRSYLKNPYLYSANSTYCTGCKKHIPDNEVFWVETGENMRVYMNKLQVAQPDKRPSLLTRLVVWVLRIGR